MSVLTDCVLTWCGTVITSPEPYRDIRRRPTGFGNSNHARSSSKGTARQRPSRYTTSRPAVVVAAACTLLPLTSEPSMA